MPAGSHSFALRLSCSFAVRHCELSLSAAGKGTTTCCATTRLRQPGAAAPAPAPSLARLRLFPATRWPRPAPRVPPKTRALPSRPAPERGIGGPARGCGARAPAPPRAPQTPVPRHASVPVCDEPYTNGDAAASGERCAGSGVRCYRR